ncbi:hypothetical protein BKA82DRAFT_4010479 [Pisolithus tinctorius]|nr:hypothetical protein BKA82DRAFT_4010479 [Pisolithus tinctorius]
MGNEPKFCILIPHMPDPLGLSTSSTSTSQLQNVVSNMSAVAGPLGLVQALFVPPPLACHCCPPGMTLLYLPAPLPVFVLPGHQRLAQHADAIPQRPQQQHPTCELGIFDVMPEVSVIQSTLPPSSLQKQQKQWW